MSDSDACTKPFGAFLDSVTRHNLRAETYFSAFNGLFMALAILAAPVIAVTCVQANPVELTILVAAFPAGVFFGPLWAGFGRKLGMKRLVTQMAFWANVPLFFLFWVEQSWLFVLLISISQVLYTGMKMGQSNLYHILYDRSIRGRVLGKLTFWNFLTMVPTILLAGWLIDLSPRLYQYLYPLAGLAGVVSALYYRTIQVSDQMLSPQQPKTIKETYHDVKRIVLADRAYRYFQCALFLSGAAFFMSNHTILLMVTEHFTFSAFELSLWMTVMPQLLLAISSPLWGQVLDRVGIMRTRLLLAGTQSTSLACYAFGIVFVEPILICLGSIFLGITNGGGQLTWSLASSLFAPRSEDVPTYNGIHFVLNGVRGLVMPWIGAVLWMGFGVGSVFIALAVCGCCVPIIMQTLRWKSETEPDDTAVSVSGLIALAHNHRTTKEPLISEEPNSLPA